MELNELLVIAVAALFLTLILYVIWLRVQLAMYDRSLGQITVIQPTRNPDYGGAGGGCLVVLLFLTLMFALMAVLLRI